MQITDHYNGKIFLNPVPTTVSKPGTFWNSMWQFLTVKGERTPLHIPGPFTFDPAAYERPAENKIRVTWLGHTTLLLEIAGKRFLTDPVWAKRASPLSFMGPARFFDVPVSLDKLPQLDGILLSHDHYDHLDENVIRRLALTGLPFYCPLGVDQHLLKWGVKRSQLHVFDWWQELVLDDSLTLIATPARHFSGRSLLDRNKTLWTSWVLKGREQRLFFGGDSGWFPGFAEIGQQYGPFDLTILEIGAYHENWSEIHMGPENAVRAHEALHGKVMLPVHWGTFNLALHPWTEPPERLIAAAAEKQVQLWMPVPGACGELPEQGEVSYWWR